MSTPKKTVGRIRQSVRLSPADNKLVLKAADLERMSVNTFLTRAALAAAKETIAAHNNTTTK